MTHHEMGEIIAAILQWGVFIGLLVLACASGMIVDYRRRKYLETKEEEFRDLSFSTVKTPPPGWENADPALVTGSVVIANNYFKGFMASLRNIFGGEMKSYRTLLDQARRVAIIRMLEEARQMQAETVINVRLETASIQGNNQRKGSAGVELIAYGTALIRPH
ncbi:MAG: YbjQ family protein [Victivallales bacterium]|nr:YbjQ family protein [Victivallales bacterium]